MMRVAEVDVEVNELAQRNALVAAATAQAERHRDSDVDEARQECEQRWNHAPPRRFESLPQVERGPQQYANDRIVQVKQPCNAEACAAADRPAARPEVNAPQHRD